MLKKPATIEFFKVHIVNLPSKRIVAYTSSRKLSQGFDTKER